MPDSLLSDDTINLYGDVGDPWGWGDGFTVTQVADALAAHGDGPINVRINSGGGIAVDGVAIYSLLKAHAGAITVYVDGLAASAASLIAMSGDRIEMRDGAMLMIHDVSGMTFGNAADHQKQAETLDKMSDQYAGIYARRASKDVGHARTLMQAETWLSADDAIAEGLADAKMTEAARESAKFDYRVYAHAPASLVARTRSKPAPQQQPTAQQETTPMPKTAAELEAEKAIFDAAVTKAAADLVAKADAEAKAKADAEAAARNAPKAWAGQFYALAGKYALPVTDINTIFNGADTLDAAKDGLIDALAKVDGELKPNGQRTNIIMGTDARDKFVAGASQAMLARAGLENRDGKNEFNGIGPMELARQCAARANIKTFGDTRKMVAAVITQGNSDFPNIAANIAEKSMMKGYGEAQETFEQWTSVGDVPDFKQALRLDLNPIQSLAPLPEGAEYTYVGTSDLGEYYSVATYGNMLSITRNAIINDDMNAFTRIPRKFGVAAKRTIGDLVFGVLKANPNMADGNALFSTAHSNVMTGAGSALSATSLQAARLQMIQQQSRNSAAIVAAGGAPIQLGIRPKHLLTPSGLFLGAKQILKSTAQIGQSNPGVTNPAENLVDSVVEEWRLDALSATGWYLLADQNLEETVEVFYLNGEKNPFMEEQPGWNMDGMIWKIRIDVGVKALLWETMQLSAGA